jgi:xanthine dehydrogenase large subunit
VVATVDCLRGRYEIDKVLIAHDFGNSMNSTIDLGQVEGGIVQGIGWMTLEELSFNQDGNLLSNSLSTYKVPDIYSAPKQIECIPINSEGPTLAILKSKAVGEPPLMYGIGAYFAIRNAIRTFNPNAQLNFNAPLTPEKVLLALYNHTTP